MHDHSSPIYNRCRSVVILLAVAFSFSSCVTYRVQTHVQEATEFDSLRVSSLFWGIAQSPKIVSAATCDSLHLYGMSEVSMRRSFGDYMLSLVTVGIYNPAKLKWKCAKGPGKTGTMTAPVAKPASPSKPTKPL
jgi:hypothetical protein